MATNQNYLLYGGMPVNSTPAPRGRGLLNLIGAATGASRLAGGDTMDQWGGTTTEPMRAASPFWDYLLSGGEGARRAEAMNDRAAMLQQGLRLEALKQAYALELENQRSGNTIKENNAKGKDTRRTNRQTSDLGVLAKDGVTSAGKRDFNKRVTPGRVRTAEQETSNALTESTARENIMFGRPSNLNPELQEALRLGQIGGALRPAADTAKVMQVDAGPGDTVMFPSVTNLMGGLGTLVGAQPTMTDTESGGGMIMENGKFKGMTPKINTRTSGFNPSRYLPPYDPNIALAAQERIRAKRAAEAAATTQQSPTEETTVEAPAWLLQGLNMGQPPVSFDVGLGSTPTAATPAPTPRLGQPTAKKELPIAQIQNWLMQSLFPQTPTNTVRGIYGN